MRNFAILSIKVITFTFLLTSCVPPQDMPFQSSIDQKYYIEGMFYETGLLDIRITNQDTENLICEKTGLAQHILQKSFIQEKSMHPGRCAMQSTFEFRCQDLRITGEISYDRLGTRYEVPSVDDGCGGMPKSIGGGEYMDYTQKIQIEYRIHNTSTIQETIEGNIFIDYL